MLAPKVNIVNRCAISMLQRNMHLLRDRAYINGEWVASSTGKTFDVKNPADGKTIHSVPDMVPSDVTLAIKAAKEAAAGWQETPAKQRSDLLRKWFELLQNNSEHLAEIITAEAGKPMQESRGEVFYGNSFIEWFSEEARRIKGELMPWNLGGKKMMVERLPIGVTALIAPWNFPHAMIARKAGAALAAGCTCVIKPAEDTPLTALAMIQLAEEAGFPKGVINVITCDRPNAASVGNILCTHKDVAGISFTGSTAVGKLLYRQCSEGVKRLGLELGGNAPFIIFNSADLKKAVPSAVASKFRNCGQTCVSANRFLVQEEIYDEFVARFQEEIAKITLGPGNMDKVTAGPLINVAQFEKVSEMVQDAVDKGATVLIGGKAAPKIGELFYEPTLLVGVKEDMRVYNEEVFGPVATIIKFKTEEEGLRIANSTQGGLAGYFCSENLSQVFRVSRLLEVGMVGVNEGAISTTEAPFGGIKESGIGREGSHHGIEEYTYYKYICVGNL